MTSGYAYGELEPKEKCPYCKTKCFADFVDVGVGFIQCGPYHCQSCGASEIGPNDAPRVLSDLENDYGWYAPGREAGSSANVDEQGNHISYHEADSLYRRSLGVLPRYDAHGNLLKNKS